MAEIRQGDIPFRFLIGNRDKVPWCDAAVAYITFYHLLFKNIDLYDCHTAMKIASGNNKFDIHHGLQVHLNWINLINYNQQTQQNIVQEVARKLRQQQIRF